jgi:hypothetical protein
MNVVSTPSLDLPRIDAWLGTQVPPFRGIKRAERIVGGNSNAESALCFGNTLDVFARLGRELFDARLNAEREAIG